jgi:hypothetical protein
MHAAQHEVFAACSRETQAVYDLETAAAEYAHAQGVDLPDTGVHAQDRARKRP